MLTHRTGNTWASTRDCTCAVMLDALSIWDSHVVVAYSDISARFIASTADLEMYGIVRMEPANAMRDGRSPASMI